MRKLFCLCRNNILFTAFIFLLTHPTYSQPISQIFNSSGTYNVPGYYYATVTIEAWGAGGGGGTTVGGARGGGGGGAYASTTTTLAPGNYTVTVGTGGGLGVNGGASSFTTIVIAAGGDGSPGTTIANGGTVAASTGTTRITGGNGNAISGNNGGSGGAGGNGGGNGGPGGPANNGSAGVAIAPGGGGGGKAGPGVGGVSTSGANGRVVVTVVTVLPVRYSNIRLNEKNSGIDISWNTSVEASLDKFMIGHSTDGSDFSIIGEVDAKNLPGSEYNFLHTNVQGPVHFYRLQAIDIDGRSAFSNISMIKLNKIGSDISIFPNPVRNGNLSFGAYLNDEAIYIVRIYNSAGQEIYQRNFYGMEGNISQTILLPAGTKPGVYSLKLEQAGKSIPGKLFIVE